MQIKLKLYATLTDHLPASARRDNQLALDVDGIGEATLSQVAPRVTL